MNNTLVVLEKVKKVVNEYEMLPCGATVIVGLSGGADSVCLLHVLSQLQNEYGVEIVASHVNHGIRGDEAKRDADFSRKFAESLNLAFELLNVNCIEEAKKNNETVEEAGRRLRYAFWDSLATEKSVIATAHNSNDNVETVIFNLARGSALNGAKGIPPKRGNIIRPLILCTRNEIEGYCEENKLQFVTDSTNLSDDYTRNRIRHFVLPELEKINPAFLEAFSRFSASANEDACFLDELASEKLKQAQIEENVYDVSVLNAFPTAIKNRVILKAITKFSKETPDNKKLCAVLDSVKAEAKVQLYKNCYCETKDGKLRFFEDGNNNYEAFEEEVKIPIEDFSQIFGGFLIESKIFTNDSVKNGGFLLDNLIDCDTINGNLTLRTRREGDKITLLKRNVTKSLKKLFIEENVKREERDIVPVLTDEHGVVWVYGFGVNKRNAVNENTKKIMALKGEKYGFTKNDG